MHYIETLGKDGDIGMTTNPIKVLIVDDSAFIRKTIVGLLNSEPGIHVVGEGVDGEDAIQKVRTLAPDIMTMDIEMPRINGLDALRIIMEKNPVPVIMVSSLTEESAREIIKALEYGAVDFIPKNLSGNITNIVNIKNELIEKIKLFGKRKIVHHRNERGSEGVKPALPLGRCFPLGRNKINIVVIGASTGGPKSLQDVIPRLPKNFPCGVLIVQHMLPVFTASFAERIKEMSHIEVREARDGDTITPGLALVAPGGFHLTVKKRSTGEHRISLSKEPPMPHMPSVDVTMKSVAQVYSEHVLGVIMTGMGRDGQEGIKAIKRVKGKTIAQDEASSVIFGMPKAAIESGCIDKVVPLGKIAEEIINMF